MNILVLGTVHQSGIKYLLNKSYKVYEFEDQNLNYKENLGIYDGLIVKMNKIDSEFLKQAKNLKVIARHGVGYNNIDISAINEKKIPLFITGDVNSTSVAEHTLGLILDITKKISLYDRNVRKNNFVIRNSFKSRDLENKKILICGFGRIGKKVSQFCKAFSMNISIYDKYLDFSKNPTEFNVVDNLEGSLSEFDFISIHIPFNNSEKALIDKNFLNNLKDTCSIINTSRGDLVNESEMLIHLQNNKNFYYGTDVFNPEPPLENSELFKLDNIVMTPHSAAYTSECVDKMSLYSAINIDNFFNKKIDSSLLINKEIYN